MSQCKTPEMIRSTNPQCIHRALLEYPQNLFPCIRCERVQEDKECSGSVLSLITNSPLTPSPEQSGSKDNLSVEKEDSSTGSCSSAFKPRNLYKNFVDCLEQQAIGNSPEAQQHPNTSGKKIPESPVPNSNSDPDQSYDHAQFNGPESGNSQQKEILWRSKKVYVYNIIELSDKLHQTIVNRLEWSDLVLYSGVVLEQESQHELGRKRVWTVTVKILGQNSGAVTEVKKILLSMNLGVLSTSLTYCDGWTVSQSTLKSKDQAFQATLVVSG